MAIASGDGLFMVSVLCLSIVSPFHMDTKPAKQPLADLSSARKIVLLSLFCLAQFLETFNTSTLFSAIPVIATSTGLSNNQSVWLYSAYQLTFAALLLISGRMSDIYNPKVIMLSGMYLVGFLSLGIGFARDDIVILVLRALSGIGAALTIPSSLHMLIHTFPDPIVQAKAVSAFAGSAVVANLLGVIVGALVVSYVAWPWVFYVEAILALLIAVPCTFLIPRPHHSQNKPDRLEQFRRLDISGCSLLIAALVLFIFAVTSGSTNGWKTATALVPLFLSILLLGSFFVWEARISEGRAALPPRLWFYPNFAPLAVLALLPYAWWGTIYLMFAWYWQEVQNWSVINSCIHFLSIGLVSGIITVLPSMLQRRSQSKHILLGGLCFMMAGTTLLPFANDPNRYWPIAFPGFVLGTSGTTAVFTTANIAIFAATPPDVAGTVGAVFNCALLLGSAVITSVATSIQTSIQSSSTSFKGRGAALSFLIAFIVMQIISVLVFVRKTGKSQVY